MVFGINLIISDVRSFESAKIGIKKEIQKHRVNIFRDPRLIIQ